MTWQRLPGETTKDWIVSPEGHQIPLGGDVDKILVYLNALEARAALLDEAESALAAGQKAMAARWNVMGIVINEGMAHEARELHEVFTEALSRIAKLKAAPNQRAGRRRGRDGKPTYSHERFCKRCEKWVQPYASAATLYGITTYNERCPGCTYAVNFSLKRPLKAAPTGATEGTEG